MLNKKMILSIFILGFVCVGVAGATWAAFIDTVTSTNNQINTASIDMKVNNTDAHDDGHGEDVATFTGLTISDAYPGQSGIILQSNPIKNTGSSNIDVYVVPVNATTNVTDSNMVVNVGTQAIFTEDAFIPSPIKIITDMLPGATDNLNGIIKYTYTDISSNQNDNEGKTMTFGVKYIAVPAGANTPP